MKSFQYIITEAVGIHARPASMLVKVATACDSSVILESGGKRADVKRLLALMALGVKCGQEVTFFIEGADEDASAQKLEDYCKRNL